MTLDCLAGYHLDPRTCGIAKFNAILSERSGLPVVSVNDLGNHRPFLSVNLSEFSTPHLDQLQEWVVGSPRVYDVFFHAFSRPRSLSQARTEHLLATRARTVYAGNTEVADSIRTAAPGVDVREAWCPGMVRESVPFLASDLVVFAFGMAHKIQTDWYRVLRDILHATGQTYAVYVSTAIHAHTSYESSVLPAVEALREVFGARVYFLGCLSDAAVHNQVVRADVVAAFFDRGVRANNTTVNAAMECGCPVVTNLDAQSPPGLVHLQTIIDVQRCHALPDRSTLRDIGQAGRVYQQHRDWPRLVTALGLSPEGVACHVTSP